MDDLRAALGADRASAEPLELALYARDAGVTEGRALAVCWPRSTEEVAAAVRVARRHSRPVVARGSGTSLSGGSLPIEGGIVIGLNRLDRILELDADRRFGIRYQAEPVEHLDGDHQQPAV